MEIDGLPIGEVSSSRLAAIVRYGGESNVVQAACRTEIWRREQGRGSATDESDADEVNRLLVESKRKG